MGSSTRGPRGHEAVGSTIPVTRREALALAALGMVSGTAKSVLAAPPQGQITYAVHISLASTWFDPAETSGIITPYMLLYALHDAMAKGMPGQPQTPCLAESWSVSEDGLTYDFVLRRGTLFHDGEPVTAEDVKFSFERYHGASHGLMKQRVAAVETADPRHVTFKLKQPWPDFLTFYAGATGAGWIVPKKYVEKIGDEGFRKAPVGAGPYRFVSFDAGVELVLEAFDQYWRKPPSVKRLVLKVVPDEATRLAALKAGEVDIAYSIRGEFAQELQRIPGLTLKSIVLKARILNQGSIGVVPGIKIAFYTVNPKTLIGVVQTPGRLLPGQSELVSISFTLPVHQNYTVEAVADDNGSGVGAASECNEGNNASAPLSVGCTTIN